MFILSSIKVNSPQILFFPDSRRFLKFQINSSTKRHPFPSKFISSHEIQWDVEQAFPESLYGRVISFQIFPRHEYGYSQQQLSSVLHGEITVERDADLYHFEVYRSDDSKKVGSLHCRIKHRGKHAEEVVENQPARRQVLMVRSIVAHIPSALNRKISFRLKVAHRELKTSSIFTVRGDLVFAEQLVFNKTDLDRLGMLMVFERKGDGEVKVGEGKINLVGEKPPKKVILMDLDDQFFGQAYIDCAQQFIEEENRLKSNSLSNYLQKFSYTKDSIMKYTSISGGISPTFKKISAAPNQSIAYTVPSRYKQVFNPQLSGTRSSSKTKLSFGQFRLNRIANKGNKNWRFSINQELIPHSGRSNLPTIWDRS